MLSRFHTIQACHGRSDGQTDRQTDRQNTVQNTVEYSTVPNETWQRQTPTDVELRSTMMISLTDVSLEDTNCSLIFAASFPKKHFLTTDFD